jgi:N-methylhydantoinase B
VFNSIDHTVPPNAGSFRRIRVLLRENCVVGIPRHPTSCSVATTNVADHVANGVQRAIAELAEGAGMAEVGSVIPPSVGVISGTKPGTGEAFVNQIFLGFGGGAASPTADAWVTIGHVGNAGLCYQDSAEVDEQVFPIFVKDRHFVSNTGGAGRYRGGSGMQVEFGPDGCDLEVGYVSDGTLYPAQGARGGGRGGRAEQYVRHANGECETLEACAQVQVREGETIVSLSCGGGGFGSPLERPLAEVAHDVREKWISAEAAQRDYGVTLGADGEADIESSEQLRAEMAAVAS